MTTPLPTTRADSPLRAQRGAAAIMVVLMLLLGLLTLLTFRLDRKQPELDADKRTTLALAQAKEALLGYAARDVNRPGSLPCADVDDDGTLTPGPDLSCSPNVIGRIPWKILALPDLRDGNGERLWYALSPKFRANAGTSINSQTLGQITLRDAANNIVNDATSSTGVIAVILAPGRVLTRQGAASSQDRSCAGGGGCNATFVCQLPYQNVAKCDPTNYLDIFGEDNATFVGSSQNGFLASPVRDAANPSQFVVNDRVLVITYADLSAALRKRVFSEVRGSTTPSFACSGASSATGLLGYDLVGGKFPWAATTLGGNGQPSNYSGYLPAADLTFASRSENGNTYCQWDVMQTNGWAPLISYTVSKAYAPNGSGSCNVVGDCLEVSGKPNAKAKINVDGIDFGIW